MKNGSLRGSGGCALGSFVPRKSTLLSHTFCYDKTMINSRKTIKTNGTTKAPRKHHVSSASSRGIEGSGRSASLPYNFFQNLPFFFAISRYFISARSINRFKLSCIAKPIVLLLGSLQGMSNHVQRIFEIFKRQTPLGFWFSFQFSASGDLPLDYTRKILIPLSKINLFLS